MTTALIVGLNYAPEPTGIAPYTAGLARGLTRAGHRVQVIAGFPYYPAWRIADGYHGLIRHEHDRAGPADTEPVSVTRLRHYVPSSSTGWGRVLHEASFAAHVLVRTLTPKDHPDVVIGVSPSLLSTAAARVIARRLKVPFGIVVQDIYASAGEVRVATGQTTGDLVRGLERSLFTAADGIVVVHENFKHSLTAVHGVAPERITVIKNWSHVRPTSLADRSRIRAELGWPDDRVVVLHAGNMGVKQNLTSVVAAGRLAAQRSCSIHFVLLGDGSRRNEVARAAADVDTVSVCPPVPGHRFPDVLDAADVLLVNEVPGLRSMSVPSKLTSYFAAGRPIVAASEPDSPAGSEVLAARAGVVVPPSEPEALLRAAVQLGRDVDGSARMSANGKHYAQTALNEEKAVKAYAKWVDELAPEPAR